MTDEAELRDQIVDLCRSLFERGLAHGSAGNVSARLDANVLVSPTNSCLGRLDPARLSKVTLAGKHVGGDKPSKEAPLHLGIYKERPRRRRDRAPALDLRHRAVLPRRYGPAGRHGADYTLSDDARRPRADGALSSARQR